MHLACVEWSGLAEPPFYFRLPEIRARFRDAREQLEALEKAGKLLRAARSRWPANAFEHAERIVAVFQHLDLRWPHDGSRKERKRKDWYDSIGPKDH